MTEAQIVRLAGKVDWIQWSETQVIIEEAGNGATRVLRDIARKLGLGAEISRAATNVILLRLSWKDS
jgi:hypothetical protein